MRLEVGYFLLFHCFHSRFSRGKECIWSVFEECILFPGSDQNAKGRFFEFPFPLSKNQGMAFAESGCFHSSLPKTQEWFLIKQVISILRSCAGPPRSVARRRLPGRKAASGERVGLPGRRAAFGVRGPARAAPAVNSFGEVLNDVTNGGNILVIVPIVQKKSPAGSFFAGFPKKMCL